MLFWDGQSQLQQENKCILLWAAEQSWILRGSRVLVQLSPETSSALVGSI